MAAHSHQWQHLTFADGAKAQVCLCGEWRVQLAPELPLRTDPWSQGALDLLEKEGTSDVEPVADPQSD